MINALEMIIKFSNDIVKEKDIEVPARMTWMDGLEGRSSDDPKQLFKIWAKSSFGFDVFAMSNRCKAENT